MKQKLKTGAEFDAIYGRKIYCYLGKGGVTAGIKRQLRRRLRRELNKDVDNV